MTSAILPPVLLVDDEQDILYSSSITLGSAIPNSIITLDDSSKVLPLLEKQAVAVVVLDLRMPGLSGQELLQRMTCDHPQVPVLIMTAANTIEMAVECMKIGAFDYLVKPVEKSRLVSGVVRALEVNRLRGEVDSLKQHLLTGELHFEQAFAPIITRNRKMQALFHYVESIAVSDQPVLVWGETGVGKELFARAIHQVSGRKGQFVAVNVAGLDDLMFSDSLFGHRKGAFTGADQPREGFIARAAAGTLFLDEIGDLNAASQVKLLRLLQESEYYPLGSDVAKQSSARIIVATNRDLQNLITTGAFRNDLYYRLASHSCHIPPLRDRLEDIPLLFDFFLEGAATKLNRKKPQYTEELVRSVATYGFPGNIRELQSMVYDAVARHRSGLLSRTAFSGIIGKGAEVPIDVPSSVVPDEAAGAEQVVFSPFPTLQHAEEYLVNRALEIANGNQRAAAVLLGITRQALNNRLVRKRST